MNEMAYRILHDDDLLDGLAFRQHWLDLGPGVEAAEKGLDLGFVDGVDDAVVAQVGVDRHDGQVVLEAGVGSNWKMAKAFKFWG